MAKTSKKALGIGLAGVMSLGAVSGAVSAINQVEAAESQAQKDAKAKIQHTIWSINNNYAGVKNQVTWEGYIREARSLIAKMPASESTEAAALTKQVDGIADTVNAIARINHVEKSYEVNYHGIKNAAQWREYLDLAKKDMEGIDKSVFAAKYNELLQRYNDIELKVQAIEDAHYADLKKVEALFDAAKASGSLADAEKALEEAKKLGTHETSAKIVKEIEDYIAQLKEVTSISAVSAVNSKNIKIEGTGLSKIKAEAIKVEGNTVKSVTVSSDLKSLNVELADDLIPNYATSVKITIDSDVKEYKVTNGVDVKSITVNNSTFGHDRVGQYITFKINGQDMTVDYLKAAGYEVKFVATKEKGGVANLFDKTTPINTSSTGEIRDNILTDAATPPAVDKGLVGGTHNVEVQVIKNGAIVVSGEGKITIKDLNQNATVINETELYNIKPNAGAAAAGVNYDKEPTVTGAGYKMNSSKIVVGEEIAIANVMANINGDNTHVVEANVKVTSSNTSVVSVVQAGAGAKNVLKANSPGTAVVTVKVGNAEKKITINVVSEKRTLSSIKLDKSTVSLTKTGTAEVQIKTVDQYGDPIAVDSQAVSWDGVKPATGFKNIRLDVPKTKIAGVDQYLVVEDVPAGTQLVNPGTLTPADTSIENCISTTTAGEIGEMKLVIKANPAMTANSGSGKINFVNKYQAPNGVTPGGGTAILTSLNVNVTDDNTPQNSRTKLAVVAPTKADEAAGQFNDQKDHSSDLKIDLANDKKQKVRFEVQEFNSSGLNLGEGTLNIHDNTTTYPVTEDYTIEVVNTDIAEIVTAGSDIFTVGDKAMSIEGKAKGTTEIVVRDKAGNFVTKQILTVEDNKVEITKVTFKPEIATVTNYANKIYLKDIMTVEDSGNDPIIKGLTLSNTSTANVRIEKGNGTLNGADIWNNDLYLDIDGDGTFDLAKGDKVVGSIVVDSEDGATTTGSVANILNAPTSTLAGKNDLLADYVALTPSKTPGTDLPMDGKVIVKVYSVGQTAIGTPSDATKVVGSTQFKVDVRK